MTETARTTPTIKYYSAREMPWRNEDRWEVEGLTINGRIGKYALFKEMTDPMDLQGIAEYSRSAIENGQPRVATSQEVWAFADRAYDERNFELAGFLRKCMQRWSNTSSVVRYKPTGEIDETVHNYNTPIETSIRRDIVGKSGLITKVVIGQVLEPLLGTQDVNKLNDVSYWINNTPFGIWRYDQKPKQNSEGVVGFSAGDGGLGLDCDGDLLYRIPAFRVIRVE